MMIDNPNTPEISIIRVGGHEIYRGDGVDCSGFIEIILESKILSEIKFHNIESRAWIISGNCYAFECPIIQIERRILNS